MYIYDVKGRRRGLFWGIIQTLPQRDWGKHQINSNDSRATANANLPSYSIVQQYRETHSNVKNLSGTQNYLLTSLRLLHKPSPPHKAALLRWWYPNYVSHFDRLQVTGAKETTSDSTSLRCCETLTDFYSTIRATDIQTATSNKMVRWLFAHETAIYRYD